MQAADYFEDSAASHALASTTADRLFACSTESANHELDVQDMVEVR